MVLVHIESAIWCIDKNAYLNSYQVPVWYCIDFFFFSFFFAVVAVVVFFVLVGIFF